MGSKKQGVYSKINCSQREHSYMTSDFWVGRYVKVHLMISDVGRWVGQRGSDVRSAIFNFNFFEES